MRILMITSGYPPAVGGGERHCEKLSVALAGRGAEVTVLTRGGVGLPASERRDGVRVLRARAWHGGARGPSRAARLATAMSYLAAVADLTGRARRGEYDLVHLHGIDLSLAVVRALGGARLPVEVTPWCAGPDGEIALIRRRLSHRPVAASLGRVDRFQVMVPTIADELATMGVSRERTVSIPGCVVLPEGGVRPESEPPGVLFGGRFEEQKRVDTLLLAWARTRARSRGVRLVAAGAGSLHGAMKELARELDLGASVELPGNLPDWSERLARCAIFVLASRSEGMSQALLEAMAAGRACVVSDLPENRALFEDAAVYVPVGSVDALAAALDRLLDDPELRRRLGSSARKRAEDVYSIDRLVERHLEVYRGLIARRSRSGGPTPTSESSP